MDSLIEAMKKYLATNFSFYLKLHQFHWNVEGPNFPQYHKFFQKLYEEIWETNDTIAEHIRALSAYAPGSLKDYKQLTMIEDQTELQLNDQQMIAMAYADNGTVMEAIKIAYKAAEFNNEIGLSNFLQDRMDVHKKHAWMLRATMKNAGVIPSNS
jgi:starvation-inducible DNA-binding protein